MIETIILMSLFCVGIRISFEEKMIFHPVYNFLSRNLQKAVYQSEWTVDPEFKPRWIAKPFIDCAYCFPSTYGSLIFWTMFYLNHKPFTPDVLIEWAICVVCSSPVAGGLYKIV